MREMCPGCWGRDIHTETVTSRISVWSPCLHLDLSPTHLPGWSAQYTSQLKLCVPLILTHNKSCHYESAYIWRLKKKKLTLTMHHTCIRTHAKYRHHWWITYFIVNSYSLGLKFNGSEGFQALRNRSENVSETLSLNIQFQRTKHMNILLTLHSLQGSQRNTFKKKTSSETIRTNSKHGGKTYSRLPPSTFNILKLILACYPKP